VADKIMIRISTDENLHMVFYRDIVAAAIALRPSEAVCAIAAEVLDFQMPGAGIPGFRRKAAEIAKAGIYDIRGHRDEVVLPLLTFWRIFELTGLDAAAEEARRQLAAHLEKLDQAAKRIAERRAESNVPAGVSG
jgi:acyl-[acyl-carrier-protein] desaturase